MRLFSMLVAGVFLAGPAGAQVAFDRHEVDLVSAKRQTVLTGFLFGGAVAELAVVHIEDDGDRRLRIFEFDDATWVPTVDTTLRPGVSFVDVANIGGHDRLVTYEHGRLNWFDPDTETERALVTVTSSFVPPRGDEIPHVDITRDLNDDGRDDLVVPEVDGFNVFIQMEGTAFADPVKIGPATDLSRIYGADGYRYDPWGQSRVHEMDYDHDGRGDLVFWNEDHFEVHTQDERGLFAPAATTFTTGVAFDSDDLSSLATGDMTGRVLHSLSDLNGDGVGDLVVHSLVGRSISSKRSTHEVHFGAPTSAGGTAFASEVGATFQSDGSIQFDVDRHDFDRDGQVDLMFTTIDLDFLTGSLWKRIKGSMGDDVRLRLEFYRMEDGLYRNKPNTIRVMGLDGTPSHREPGWVPLDIVLRGGTHERRKTQKVWPRAFNNTLLIGDVTGDGLSDVLKGGHPRIMELLVGVPGPDLFAPQSQAIKAPIPNDEEYIWLVDLNKDGKQDIVLHHPFTLRNAHGAPLRRPGTEPHWVQILIAR